MQKYRYIHIKTEDFCNLSKNVKLPKLYVYFHKYLKDKRKLAKL